MNLGTLDMGNRAFGELRYGDEDSISPSTLIFAATKGLLGIYTLHIPPPKYFSSYPCAEAQISVLRHVLSTWSEWIKMTSTAKQNMLQHNHYNFTSQLTFRVPLLEPKWVCEVKTLLELQKVAATWQGRLTFWQFIERWAIFWTDSFCLYSLSDILKVDFF